MRLLMLALLGLLLIFQYSFWFGKNGYMDYKQNQQEIAEKQAENEKLKQANEQAAAEIKDLKEGFEAIEERARLDHDMVKDNETLYRLFDSDKK